MSSYPPPPPGGYPPYDPNAWKAQQRMLRDQAKAAAAAQKAQLRAQRMQWKAQQRAARRSTLIGPLLLVAEWAFAQHNHVPGQPYPQPAIGGGLIVLLILLAVVGFTLRRADNGHWMAGWVINDKDWSNWFGENHDSETDLSSSIASGQPLVIRSPHGDVTVTGTSADAQVHVTVHRHVHAWDDDAVPARERELQPTFSSEGSQLVLTVGSADNSDADINVEVPHETALTISTNHGDVNVSGLRSAIDITQSNGDIDATSLNGPLTIHVSHDHSDLTGHSITGAVDVEGRAGDMTFSDITGSVTMHGDFFGSTHLSHITEAISFQTSRTQFSAERLDGDLDIANGDDFSADQVVGPVTLSTSNRDITLERVQGSINITDRNGSVTTTSTRPFDSISIHNNHGSVDVGVPDGTGFVLSANTDNGDISTDDFNLSKSIKDHAEKTVSGTVSGGGPSITINTENGDITVHKSDAEPLAPAPPPAPKVVTLSPPPAPAAPGKPSTPTKPKPPSKPVGGDTF